MRMVLIIMEIGKMTSNMVSELKDGQMVQFTKVTTMKERKMDQESLHLQMALSMKETFK